jgi:hypothetical protein
MSSATGDRAGAPYKNELSNKYEIDWKPTKIIKLTQQEFEMRLPHIKEKSTNAQVTDITIGGARVVGDFAGAMVVDPEKLDFRRRRPSPLFFESTAQGDRYEIFTFSCICPL